MNIRNVLEIYVLRPSISQNQKSFYGKAHVIVYRDGAKTLVSYGTKIIWKNKEGECYRLWDGWSHTTAKHIYAFCGLRKRDYEKLPLLKIYD